jgi:hypoxanthine phosphoribosyltransferase
MYKPDRFRLIYSKAQINDAIQPIAREISGWCSNTYNETGRDVIAVPILRGGLFFFVDLVRCLTNTVQVQPVRTMGYLTDQVGVTAPELQIDLMDCQARDRSILLVDDICDSGRTLKHLTTHLLRAGAREVRAAVLIQRVIVNPEFDPEWKVFQYSGDEWFVGYGMEELDRYRNLSDVYIIQPSK